MSSELPDSTPTIEAVDGEPDRPPNGADRAAQYELFAPPGDTGAEPDALFRLLVASVRDYAITAVRDRSGGLVGFAKVTRDLTDRKRPEDERERFRMFVDSVQEYAMFIVDPGGKVETWNVGAERIFSHRADEIIGRRFSELYPAEDVEPGKCHAELELAARDGHFDDEGWRIRKDGTRFWASAEVTAIRQPGGQLVKPVEVRRLVDAISELTC